jgi:proteic killer suppression protein
MEVVFKTDRLRRDCCDSARMQAQWGERRAKVLRRRLDQIAAVGTLADLRLVHSGTHELKGDRAGQISLDLDGAQRLIVEPAEDPPPRKPDGGLDWQRITAVRVLAVEDTHA